MNGTVALLTLWKSGLEGSASLALSGSLVRVVWYSRTVSFEGNLIHHFDPPTGLLRRVSKAPRQNWHGTSLFIVYIPLYTVYTCNPRGAICMLVLVLKPTGDFRRHSFHTGYENSTRIPNLNTSAMLLPPSRANGNDSRRINKISTLDVSLEYFKWRYGTLYFSRISDPFSCFIKRNVARKHATHRDDGNFDRKCSSRSQRCW